MPSNKQQIMELECRKNLDKILTTGLKEAGELSMNKLIIETTLRFPVGELFVIRFIKRYEEAEYIKVKGDTILPVRT